jgi:TPR repeat protein
MFARVIAALFVLVFGTAAWAETRVALVIGNGAYRHMPQLSNPPNDASDIAAMLTGLGFDVDLGTDLPQMEMQKRLTAFERKASTADVALVFFAGHGLQHAGLGPNGQSFNYLLPVDADIQDEADLRFLMKAQDIADALQAASRIRILILDACRDNNVPQRIAPKIAGGRGGSVSRGLAPMPAASGTLIAFSTQAGAIAADGVGRNSQFAAALMKHLPEPGADVRIAFAEAREDVFEATKRTQLPEVWDSLIGRFSIQPASGASAGESAGARASGATVAMVPVATFRDEDPLVLACDRLAASPFDRAKPSGIAGVESRSLAAEDAVQACRPALDAYPNSPRLKFELGRALGALKRDGEALPLYRASAEAGYAVAMVNLGAMYGEGRGGLPKSESDNAYWQRKAAEAGNPIGMVNFGNLVQSGRGVPKNFETAANWFRKAAEAGIAPAMTSIGSYYERGQGVAKSEADAVAWYRKAADAGDARGMYNLGAMYAGGRGVPRDDAEALSWYRKAADRGSNVAMTALGVDYATGRKGLAKDDAEAVNWFRKAADAGDPSGMADLGLMFESGRGGLAKSDADAATWYRKAADAGSAFGALRLGLLSESGRGGLARSDADAAVLYRKAAQAGEFAGMYNLGKLLIGGRGVEKNEAEGANWLRKAAEAGVVAAMNDLGVLYVAGRGVNRDEARAVEWYRKAADAGNLAAMSNLAGMSMRGAGGLAKSDAEAVNWLRKAAEGGHTLSMRDLGTMYRDGRGVRASGADAVRWFSKAAAAGNVAAMRDLGFLFAAGFFDLPVSADGSARWLLAALRANDKEARTALIDLKGAKLPLSVRKAVQALLMANGAFKGPADGSFGDPTLAALKSQAGAGAPSDIQKH